MRHGQGILKKFSTSDKYILYYYWSVNHRGHVSKDEAEKITRGYLIKHSL